jgi:hypothetical protein
VTSKFCGSRAATEEGTMILVNSKDVVAGRIRDIQALSAPPARRPRNPGQRRGNWRGLAATAGALGLVRPQSMIKAVEEL